MSLLGNRQEIKISNSFQESFPGANLTSAAKRSVNVLGMRLLRITKEKLLVVFAHVGTGIYFPKTFTFGPAANENERLRGQGFCM